MSQVYIWEYNDMARDRIGEYTGMLQEPSLNTVNSLAPKEVSIVNSNRDSAQFRADCHFIVIIGDVDFRYEINSYLTSKDATFQSRKALAGVYTTLAVPPGGFLSVCQLDPIGQNLAFNDKDNSSMLLLIAAQ